MAGVVPVPPRFQFSSTTGGALAGGFVDVYLAGSTTRSNSWADRAQTSLNTNPIVLDASGSCAIFVASDKTYKFVVKNSAGVVQSHLGGDNIAGSASAASLADAVTAGLVDIETARAAAVADVEAAETTATDAMDILVAEAEAAQTAAELARDEAYAATKIYASTAAGLAAVASGEYFYVPSTVATESFVLYRDDAGVATEIDRIHNLSDQETRQRVEKMAEPTPVTPYAEWFPLDADPLRGLIKNRQNAGSAPVNKLHAVNGVNLNSMFGSSQATLTPDSTNDLFRSTFAGGVLNGLGGQVIIYLKAGQYTVTADYRCKSGGTDPQTFRNGTSLGQTAQTIAGSVSYTAKSHTFTHAADGNATLYFALKDAANNAYDIEWKNPRVHSGASDLGADTDAGDLFYGTSDANLSNPTFATYTAGAQYAIAKLATAKTFNEFTIVVAFKQTGNTGATPAPFLSGDNYTTLSFGSASNQLYLRAGAATQVVSEKANFKGRGWVIALARVKNGVQQSYINNVMVAQGTGAFAGVSTKVLYQMLNGGAGTSSLSGLGEVGPVVVYDSYLGERAMYKAVKRMRECLRASGNIDASIGYSAAFLGDSLTLDAIQVGAGGTGSHAYRVLTDNSTTLGGAVYAQAGSGIDYAIARATELIPSMRNAAKDGNPLIVMGYIGVNDHGLGITVAADWYVKFQQLSAIIMGNGGKFIASTVPPRNNAPHNTWRAQVNPLLRADTTLYDALLDVDLLAIGADGAPAALVYYYDLVHLNGAGYDILTPAVQAKIDAVIATI